MILRTLSLATLAVALAAPAPAEEGRAGSWTGYVTDSHCGKRVAAEGHGADCIERCVKGGATPQLVSEADGKTYRIDGWDKVKGLLGGKVTVMGTLRLGLGLGLGLGEDGSGTIIVASAEKATN